MIKQSLLMLSLLCVGSTFGMGWGWGGSVSSDDRDKMDQMDADNLHRWYNESGNDEREQLGIEAPSYSGFLFSDYDSSIGSNDNGSSTDTSSNSDDNIASSEPINDSSNQDN